ncbi:MAG TPA: thioesterase family protein [Polyangiaceae bacterium]
MDPEALRQVMEELIPFNKVLGIKVVEIDKGHVRMQIPFREELIGDPMRRAMHGGVISALADTAGGASVWSALEEPRARVSTIDMRIDYLRPGRPEMLVAEANVVRVGRRVGVTEMRVFHPSAPTESVATGKGVYNVVIPKGA